MSRPETDAAFTARLQREAEEFSRWGWLSPREIRRLNEALAARDDAPWYSPRTEADILAAHYEQMRRDGYGRQP